MKHIFISCVFVISFFLLGTSKAQAFNPSFALAFKFDPPLTTITPLTPLFYLDVCATANCSLTLKSMLMTCTVQRAGLLSGASVIGCMVQAVAEPSFPDPNMLFLNHPINLRIRENNLVSPIFLFPGGQAAIPEVFYNYTVTPGGPGFIVSPG